MQLLEHIKRDERCKVVVWTGAGRAFCAGGNFTDSSTTVPDEVFDGYPDGRVDSIAVKVTATFTNCCFDGCTNSSTHGGANSGIDKFADCCPEGCTPDPLSWRKYWRLCMVPHSH